MRTEVVADGKRREGGLAEGERGELGEICMREENERYLAQ